MFISEMLRIAEASQHPEGLISEDEFRTVVSALLKKRSILEKSQRWSESMDELCAKLLDEMHYNHNIETDDIESNLNINENSADEVFSTTSPKKTHSVGSDTSANQSDAGRITMKILRQVSRIPLQAH